MRQPQWSSSATRMTANTALRFQTLYMWKCPNVHLCNLFQVGMKVECTDLMDPRLVCVSTINRVVNR